MRTTRLLTLAAVCAVAGCTDRAPSPTLALPGQARASRSDATNGGTPGFYFLSPIAPKPAVEGDFAPNLSPSVSLCLLHAGRCRVQVAEYTSAPGPQGKRVQVNVAGSHYAVGWDTRRTTPRPGDTVRVSVAIGSRTLGFADVVVVNDAADGRSVDADEYVPVLIGRTLSIRFRIETQVAPFPAGPEPSHTWTPTSTDGQGSFGVWGSSAEDVYLANWMGMWHFDGSAWSAIPELEWHATLDVYGFGAGDVWAVGPAGRILHYNGSSWSSRRYDGSSVRSEPLDAWVNPQGTLYLWGVWGAAANDVFVAGDSGTVLHWNGAAWARMSTGTTAGLRRVWGNSGRDVYVSGEAGTLLHYDGTGWSRVAVPTGEDLTRIWGSSAGDVYVGGANATLLHFDGSGWSRVALPIEPTSSVNAVWGTSRDNVYVAGSAGFVMRWDGAGWVREESGRPEQILGLWGASGTDVFASMAGGWVTRR